ncbi:hypothetical protein [Actinomadura fibrosa]|uniref:Exo-alpha-sialidase n=2 Tax=Actinomadura fibrosa TaxID=111802 RepID=A0ABW2XY34_9ACTN
MSTAEPHRDQGHDPPSRPSSDGTDDDKLVASWRTAPPPAEPPTPPVPPPVPPAASTAPAPVPPAPLEPPTRPDANPLDEPTPPDGHQAGTFLPGRGFVAPGPASVLPPDLPKEIPRRDEPWLRPAGAARGRRGWSGRRRTTSVTFDRPRAEPTPPKAPRATVPGRRSGLLLLAVSVLVSGAVVYAGSDDDTAGGAPARPADGIFAARPALYDGHPQDLTGVAVRGPTAVAVGSETIDRPRGQILASSDGGRTWATAQVRGGDDPSADVPRVVAAGGHGWTALGDGPAGTAVWTSPDGRNWTRRPRDEAAFDGGDRVAAVTATATGFAAAGTARDGRSLLWTSANGAAWRRTAAFVPARPVRLAASGEVLVALDERGDVWRSSGGGGAWARAQVPQSDGSKGPVVALASGPGGFFAAREGRPGGSLGAVVTWSADGAAWSRAGVIGGRDYARLAALGGSEAGLAALVPLTDGRLGVQRSADGVGWQEVERLDGGGGRTAEAAAPLPDGVLVAGRQDTGGYLAAPGARRGDVDLLAVPGAVAPDRTVTRLVSGGGTVLALGSVGGEAAVWRTRDGASWTRATGTGEEPGAQRLAGGAYGPRGWVLAGRGARRDRPLLLTSGDGAAWTPAALPADRPGELSGAAHGRAGYVVVGSDSGGVLAWHSDDLARWTAGTGDLQGGKAHDVATVTRGYVAVGASANGAPAAWTSADGAVWTAVRLPAGPAPTRVVARGDTAVATGPGGTAAVSSDGGRTWRAEPLKAAGLTAALATPRGFVLAGTPPGTSDVALWTSSSGGDWRTVRPYGRGLDGGGPQWLTGLALLGGDLLATGTDGGVPTLWRARPP